ncbi:hypothetical protein Anas_11840 [Armadillidium nasatum]|uniref:Transmembrane protein n=1 Tax=Armadillidium nasatum TaxID=96803 RepID=A0A5N5T340_9CRUS|nr:hypothetical protein Anas_11840 [Armadillidium nasatum]
MRPLRLSRLGTKTKFHPQMNFLIMETDNLLPQVGDTNNRNNREEETAVVAMVAVFVASRFQFVFLVIAAVIVIVLIVCPVIFVVAGDL